MTFKESVVTDLDTFFSLEEFAEPHDLNGTTCAAIVEGLTTKQRSARAAENYEGMFKSALTVHARAADLPEIPVHGQLFKVDGKLYTVDTADKDCGILTIGLAVNSIECRY